MNVIAFILVHGRRDNVLGVRRGHFIGLPCLENVTDIKDLGVISKRFHELVSTLCWANQDISEIATVIHQAKGGWGERQELSDFVYLVFRRTVFFVPFDGVGAINVDLMGSGSYRSNFDLTINVAGLFPPIRWRSLQNTAMSQTVAA